MPLIRRRQQMQPEEQPPQGMQPNARLTRSAAPAFGGPAQMSAPGAAPAKAYQPAGQTASLADYFRANMGQQTTKDMAAKSAGQAQQTGNQMSAMSPELAGFSGAATAFGSAGGGLGMGRATGNIAAGNSIAPTKQLQSPTEADAKAVEERSKLLGTQGGREEALRQDYGGTTRGGSALDAALLGNAPGVSGMSQKYAGLADKFRAKPTLSADEQAQQNAVTSTTARSEQAGRWGRGDIRPGEEELAHKYRVRMGLEQDDAYWNALMGTGSNVDPSLV